MTDNILAAMKSINLSIANISTQLARVSVNNTIQSGQLDQAIALANADTNACYKK